ncbi:MAG TPA: hypothetical protein VNW51_09840 [Mucilaginibacter sp.]|jgi:hypothetical protein|nr:hypothetical protein [Mucilaginibacter sp.]
MKNLILITFTAVAAIFVLQGCEKARMADIGDGKLKASKAQVGLFEVDTLLFTGAAATDSVNWTVTPASHYGIQTHGNAAIVTFFTEGTYLVSARKVSGGVTQSVSIKAVQQAPVYATESGTTKTTVVTSANPDTAEYIPITGDIKVTTAYFRLPSGDSVILNLNLQTVKTYCSKGILQYTSILDAGNFNLDIVNIRAPKNCAGATSPDWQTWTGMVFKTKFIGLGTHQLTITYNNVTYTGTIVVTRINTTINWNYTSGVVIPDKVIDM